MKFLLEEVTKLTKQADKSQKDLKSRIYIIDKLHKEGTERDDKVKEINKKLADLENKSVDLDNKSFQFNTEFESFKMNYQIQSRTVSGLRERVDELEEIQENFKSSSQNIKIKDYSSMKMGSNNAGEQKDFNKLIERIDGNDRLIDGLISKVQKINSNIN